jgi:hypothetical protein
MAWLPSYVDPKVLADWRDGWSHVNIDELAVYLRPQAPMVAEWLMRPDVYGIIEPLAIHRLAMAYIFFFVVIPPLSDFGWTCFDGYIHLKGFQYIPGAKVLEPRLGRKTIETMRNQLTYGGADFVDVYDAPRIMAK